MAALNPSNWWRTFISSCLAFTVGGAFLPATASACQGPAFLFYVVDSRPTILPAGVTFFRVLPVTTREWPTEIDFRSQEPIEASVVADVRGEPAKESVYLRLPKIRSMCEDFAQSKRSSYVVGKLKTENGKRLIDLVTLIDSDDIRFTGENLIVVEEAQEPSAQK